MYTADGMEIVKDMKVWICPLFDHHTRIERVSIRREEHTVIETLNNCMVSTWMQGEEKKLYLQYDRHAVFAEKKNAIIRRIEILETIRLRKGKDLREAMEKAYEESSEVRDMMSELLKEI